jgi:hypothetical protein
MDTPNRLHAQQRLRKPGIFLSWIIALIAGCLAHSVQADDWVRNLRWSADLSSQAQYVTEGRDGLGFLNSAGIDLHSTITRGNKNFATTVIQLYVARADDLNRYPPYFSSEDDWKFLTKTNSINFHISGDGRFNFLAGHAVVPYGLETSIDTTGTLRQLVTGPNLGLKADWGVGVNGDVGDVSYAMTLTRGSGLDYYHNGNPWAVTGRIGSSQSSEEFFGMPGIGLSVFTGNIRLPSGTFVDRTRVGFDGQWYRGPWGVMTEVSVGEDDDFDVVNSFLELNALSRTGSTAAYAQGRWFRRKPGGDWQDTKSWTLGLRMMPDRHWSISVQYTHEIEVFGNREEEGVLDLQLRFRS